MMKREPVEQAATGVQDPEAFTEARAVFGDADALARLRMFRADLQGHLSRIGPGPADHASLREMAHQTAGRAGILGFPALAAASARLDEAIREGSDVASALDRWTQQARRAAADPPDARHGGPKGTPQGR